MGTTYKKITSHGSVSIPVAMRRSLGMEPRDAVEVSEKDGSVVIRPYNLRCIFCGSEDIAGTLQGKGMCRNCAAKAYEMLKENIEGGNGHGGTETEDQPAAGR